jgi:acetoin:2,6-dichlorophenolindophenol oxidoreductase subunit beta
MANLRYLQALAKALRDEMSSDPSVFVLGEDVRESLRGVTVGLFKDFGPDRVIDTPISEAAFTGMATGAALAGRRPVVEYQIPSLVYVAFDQIINQAQKFHLMSGGQASVPITLLIPASGARRGLAGQHSDNPYTYLIHAGVKTVVPATAYDAYGLLVSAIRDPDPVAVLGPAPVLGRRDEVPDEPYLVPLGVGRVHREGTDVTVLAVGHLVADALAAASELEPEGISVEVYDPRSLLPFDRQGFIKSVAKTGRLVIFDDANPFAGFAAEVAAIAAEECHDRLRAPVRRVARRAVTIPFALDLEDAVLPSKQRLVDAIRTTVAHSAIRT